MISNVIIATVMKNVAPYLENHLRKTIALGQQLQQLQQLQTDWKLVVYENNSQDQTKRILQNYQNHPNCRIISEDLSPEEIKKQSKIWAYTKITHSDHPCRIEQVCNARNKLLEELSKPEYNTYDIVVMIDFSLKDWSLPGVLEAIAQVGKKKKIALSGCSNPYYDLYALRSSHSPYCLLGPELLGEIFWNNLKKDPFLSRRTIPVYSAFNGIGIYPKEVLKEFRYSCLPTPSLHNFYAKILSSYPQLHSIFPIIKKEDSKYPGGQEDDICFWKNNSGYNQPVICEHLSLSAHLLEQGYTLYIYSRLTVTPRMVYF